jgi:hypothetical protein
LNASSTKVVGGLESATPATITGTACEPITGAQINDQFKVTIGGVEQSITFLAGDFITFDSSTYTTVQRVVDKINTAFYYSWSVDYPGYAPASRSVDGSLVLKSPQTGSSSAISITGLGGFDLTYLGFGTSVPKSANGSDETRGIITKSLDGLGGDLYLAYADGYEVTASSKNYYRLPKSSSDQSRISYGQDVIPGSRVYGRLTGTTTALSASWKSKALTNLPIITRNSTFGTITAGSFDIELFDPITNNGVTVPVVFSSTPTSVSSVVTTINAAWQSATGNQTSKVIFRNTEPYYIEGSNSLNLQINGTDYSVPLVGSEVSAADYVAAINGVSGLSGLASDINGRVVLSNNTYPIVITDSDPDFLRILGIATGKYNGYSICALNGSEIQFSCPIPSVRFKFTSFSGGVNATKLGLNSLIDVDGLIATASLEVPVPFPAALETMNYSPEFTASTGYVVVMLPEFEFLGDVPDNQFSRERQNDYSGPYKRTNIASGLGSYSANTIINANDLGLIDAASMPYAVPSAKIGTAVFPPLNSNNNPAISIEQNEFYTALLEGRVNDGANVRLSSDRSISGPTGPGMFLSSNLKFAPTGSSYSTQKYTKDDTSKSSFAVASYPDNVGIYRSPEPQDSWLMSTWQPTWRFGSSDNFYTEFALDGVIRGANGSLSYSDTNILENTGTTKSYPFTNYPQDGDDLIRVAGIEAQEGITGSNYSIFRSLNARVEITIGDGTSSYGDFTSPYGIEQAAKFLSDNSITDARIHIKKGIYYGTQTISFSGNVEIIGESLQNTTGVQIYKPISPGNIFSFTGSDRLVSLKNLKFAEPDTDYSAVYSVSALTMENILCYGLRVAPSGNNTAGCAFYAKNCTFKPKGPNNAIIDLTYFYSYEVSIAGINQCKPVTFESCTFDAHNKVGARCLRISASNVQAGSYTNTKFFDSISFNNCVFALGYYQTTATTSPVSLRSTTNTGLIDLAPQNDGFQFTGLNVKSIDYNNCKVYALNTAGPNCLLQLSSTNTFDENDACYGLVNRVSFKNVDFSINLSAVGVDAISYFTAGFGAETLNIEDCSVTVTSTSGVYGRNFPRWFYKVIPSISYPDEAISGFAICVPYLNIRNLRLVNLPRKSRNSGNNYNGADILIAMGNKVIVDGFSAEYTDTGGSNVPPKQRVLVYSDPSTPNFSNYSGWWSKENRRAALRNVHFVGATSPFNDQYSLSYIFMKMNADNVILDNLQISKFNTGTYGVDGLTLVDCNSVKIINSDIRDVIRGVMISATGAGSTYDTVIANNTIESERTGINANSTDGYMKDLRILSNKVYLTNNSDPIVVDPGTNETISSTPAGIKIVMNPNSDSRNYPIISNNNINTKRIKIPAIMIAPYIVSGDTGGIGAIVHNNQTFAESPGSVGYIYAFYSDGTGMAAYPSSITTDSDLRIIGIETKTLVNGSDEFNTNYYTPEKFIIHNWAKFYTGTTIK